MIAVARHREVAAPPAAVWALLADFGAIASWAPNVDHSCLLSDRVAEVDAVRRVQLGRTTIVERVVDWDEPHGLAYRLEGLPPVVRSAVNEWRIEPAGDGSHVSLTSRVDAGPRPPQQLVARAVGRRMAAASDVMLAGLAERVQSTEEERR